jgi:TM2 domain-containing membrane protein YozV
MKILAILVNALLLPGVGTLIVGKVGQGIAQIILWIIGVALCFTVFGLVVGLPLAVGVWIWGLVSVGTYEEKAVQVHVTQNVVAGDVVSAQSPGVVVDQIEGGAKKEIS